jgi:hypothetical protein
MAALAVDLTVHHEVFSTEAGKQTRIPPLWTVIPYGYA